MSKSTEEYTKKSISLHFSVEGAFITKTAREMFYQGHNIKKAIELVKSATMTDQLSESEHLMLCLEVIAGKKDIVGVYPGDDYGIKENPEGSLDNLFNEIDSYNDKLEHVRNQHSEMLQKFGFVCGQLEDWELKRINRHYYEEYGEFLFDTSSFERNYVIAANTANISGTEMLDSYLERQNDDSHHTYADYGWLEPDGTYHEVDWGEHERWASEYLQDNYPFKDNADIYWKTDAEGTRRHYVNGDCLVYCLGWVLLDSPFQGIARATYDTVKGLTKAQKEFLYDYYIERSRHHDPNALYADEDY